MQVALLALFYYLFGELSFAISHKNSIVTVVIFAAEGFALTSVLLFGRKMWLGVFLGQLLLAIGCMEPLVGLSIAIINSLEALLAFTLFNYFNLDKKLSTTKDIFGLIALIILILQPFSAFLGNLVLYAFSIVGTAEFGKSFFSWWFGNLMGQILVTPTLLLLYARIEKTKFSEYLLIGLFFAFISYLFQIIIPIQNVSLLLSVTLPLIIYISSTRGIQYATFSVVIITTVTLYLTHINLGIFTTDNEIDNLINLNFYFLSQMLLLLIIGTLFEERKKREQELKEIIQQELKKNEEHTLMMLQQSRLAQMGQVINMIAHQWRQPLNNLLLINEVLVYKYEKNKVTKKEIDKFHHDSTLQIKQMSGTIDDFRDFFQPRREKEHFLLNDIIEHLIEIVEPIFTSSEILLSFKEEKELYTDGYPNELAQALLNILYNAKDAFIENPKEDKYINIQLKKVDKKIILTISDNAGGIPTDIIDDIFNPYFSTKKSLNGTGLGLYMSKMIIEKHMNGRLFALNNKEGATFTIELYSEEKSSFAPHYKRLKRPL